MGFEFGEGNRAIQASNRRDGHNAILGRNCLHLADDRLFFARVIEKNPIAGFDLPEVLQRQRIGNAFPVCLAVAFEVGEAVGARLFLEQPSGHVVLESPGLRDRQIFIEKFRRIWFFAQPNVQPDE